MALAPTIDTNEAEENRSHVLSSLTKPEKSETECNHHKGELLIETTYTRITLNM